MRKERAGVMVPKSFKTPLIVEVMPSGKRFKLFHSFTYFWKREYMEIHVQAGFITDFASIPIPFRILIPKLGRYNKAAVIHDALYQNVVPGCKFMFTRKEADVCFRDAMRDLGVAEWKVKLIYLGVRIGGWIGWRK